MAALEPARWAVLSPLLDEWLDLPEAGREAWLAALRARDAALAEELLALQSRQAQADARGFMRKPALPAPPGLAGQTLGAYTLVRELGRGGMGQVWLARRTDGRFEGQVAIKLLQGGLLGHGDAERFAREGRILARLDQPHIARLLDAGVGADGTQPYLVLEHVDGEPIDRYVQQRRLGPAAVVALMIDAADAVAHAHTRLILHRDLKPSNMLVRADGQLKLLDFGIAKLLDEQAGGAAGEVTQRAGAAFTPSYAAPEQLQGQEVTTATDVYALGVLLYQLLGGGHPTPAADETALARLRAVLEHEPRRLSERVRELADPPQRRHWRELRGDLDTIVAHALKKDPADRYLNAAELAEDLRRTQRHEPIRARPDRWWYRSAKFVRRHRVGVSAAALALGAVLGGAGIALKQSREAQAQRAQADALVEFMLGDLRRRLQPVGRLDVLDAVGERALAHYAAQDASGLDADALARRARALHLIGEIADLRGQSAEARRRFEEAARSTAELLARAPANPQRLFDHGQSEYWVAYAARREGRLDEARAGFERYRALAQRLIELEPGQPRGAIELAHAEQAWGVVALDQRQPQPALAAWQRARALYEAHAAHHPEARDELGSNLGWIARAHEDLGELVQALKVHQAKIALLHTNAGINRHSQYQMALAHNDAARLQLALGRYAGSQAEAESAVGLLQALVSVEPGRREWRTARAIAYVALAEALHAQGQLRTAEPALKAAAAEVALAAGTHGAAATANAALDSRDIVLRARWLTAQARQAGALKAPVDEMQALQAQVLAGGAQPRQGLNATRQRALAAMALALGDTLMARGDGTQARERWRQAESLVTELAGEPQSAVVLAHLRLRLHGPQAAAPLADRLAASPCRHPLVLDLLARLGRPLSAS